MPVYASMILSGQESPNDEAILSRCCMIHLHQNRLDNGVHYGDVSKNIDTASSFFRWYLENRSVKEDFQIFVNLFDSIRKELTEKQ